jgi:hypothetical protein
LRHPLLGEHWEEGATRLVIELPIGMDNGDDR